MIDRQGSAQVIQNVPLIQRVGGTATLPGLEHCPVGTIRVRVPPQEGPNEGTVVTLEDVVPERRSESPVPVLQQPREASASYWLEIEDDVTQDTSETTRRSEEAQADDADDDENEGVRGQHPVLEYQVWHLGRFGFCVLTLHKPRGWG
jgi:hypothetical protein